MISQQTNKPLNIYRASAGSGKTHLLTGFYIKQLFLPDLLPETHSGEMHFDEILAVTFTNKATAEMKGRIIAELFQLSQAPKLSDYWEDVSINGQKDEHDIQKKASDLLIQILNEYSSFNVSTIDSFFQKIVRSFARELNVPGNYEVELDTKTAIETAVTNFLDKLDPKQNQSLFDWMVRFSDRRSEEGEGWDIRKKLFEMTEKVLNSEAYRKHSQQIKAFTSDKQQLAKYEQMLRNIISSWKKQLTDTGRRGTEIIASYGIDKTEFYYNGAGSVSMFYSWAMGEEKAPQKTPRFMDIVSNPDKLFKKGSCRCGTEIQQAIIDLMKEGAELFCGQGFVNYKTAFFIQQDLYELGIIANIDEELRDYCNEQNIMLLNSTTELLSKLIGPYDAPFIYEKTGTHIKSYMIDEFQDTSGMQWNNFKPLVSNTLSQRYQNLIVGDVKQSIYRWRGSDWGLLDSELNHYEPYLHNDNDEALRTNWRSLPAIVEFNNQFFEHAAGKLDELTDTNQINRIYKDLRQEIPDKKKKEGCPAGLVHIEYLKPKDDDGNEIASPNSDAYLEEAKRQLPNQIIRLQQNGYEPKDIAILCRRKKECRIMAETLLQYKQEHPDCPYSMDIISSEALQLGTRPVIQTLISMMQLLQNPDSEIQKAVTWSNYLQVEGHSPEEAISIYFRQCQNEGSLLPPMAFRPIYELTELLIAKLPADVQEKEISFLQAFRDVVLEFSHSHKADLSAFLEWWETSGKDKTITTPEEMNAIQIMTIHKAKGLGMPAVIIPFASWEMDIETNGQHKQIIWCEPSVEPFKQDILLPIKLDSNLVNTIFCQDYAEERLRTVIDNLNTAYVAFTRPKEAMIIMIPDPASSKKQSRLEHLTDNYVQKLMEKGMLAELGQLVVTIEQETDGITIGQWQRAIQKKSAVEVSQDIALGTLTPTHCDNTLPSLSILHSPLLPDTHARRKGNCIHRVLQEIRYNDEYEQIIQRLYQKGIIDRHLISEAEMTEVISHILSLPDVSNWFRPGLIVLNEQTMVDARGDQIRPDRIIIDSEKKAIVIDYKTGSDHRGYRKQVKSYMQALRELGFKQVKGYLFFIKDERIIEVK